MIETEDWRADASTLPNTLHGLLEMAISDLEKVKDRPGVQINMNEWVRRTGDRTCEVCMAGAVLMETCRLQWKHTMVETLLPAIDPGFLRSTVMNKLEAINHLRTGKVHAAAITMNRLRELRASGIPDDYIITPYYMDRGKFRTDINNLVAILKEHDV